MEILATHWVFPLTLSGLIIRFERLSEFLGRKLKCFSQPFNGVSLLYSSYLDALIEIFKAKDGLINPFIKNLYGCFIFLMKNLDGMLGIASVFI